MYHILLASCLLRDTIDEVNKNKTILIKNKIIKIHLNILLEVSLTYFHLSVFQEEEMHAHLTV